MATKLRNLQIYEVGFVPEGANPDANIVILKSKKTPTEDKIEMPFDINSLPEEYRASVTKALADKDTEIERVTKEKNDSSTPAVTTPIIDAKVEPAIPEEIAKRLKDSDEARITLQKRLDAMVEADEIRTIVTKVKTDYAALTDHEIIGKALYSITKSDKALAENLSTILTKANAAVAEANKIILAEKGRNGDAPDTTAIAKYNKLVKQYISDGKAKDEFEATALVLKEHREVYNEYENERQRRAPNA